MVSGLTNWPQSTACLQRAENDPFAAVKVSHLMTGELVIFSPPAAAARYSLGITVMGRSTVGLSFAFIAAVGFAASGKDMGMVGQAI